MSYETYRPKLDLFFEVQDHPPMPSEGSNAKASMRIVDESAPQTPRQQRVGKLMMWMHVRGSWQGVVSSGGFRWTFGEKDILCRVEKLKEGMAVSFRSL